VLRAIKDWVLNLRPLKDLQADLDTYNKNEKRKEEGTQIQNSDTDESVIYNGDEHSETESRDT
jgi:hypothetical protein